MGCSEFDKFGLGGVEVGRICLERMSVCGWREGVRGSCRMYGGVGFGVSSCLRFRGDWNFYVR